MGNNTGNGQRRRLKQPSKAVLAHVERDRVRALKRAEIARGFTPHKKTQFLAHYANGGTVKAAARKVGISHVTVFNHVRDDKAFAEAYARALELNTDQLEDLLHQFAERGMVAALFGTLKARRPEKWRDNFKIDHTNSDGSFRAFAEGAREATRRYDADVKPDDATTTH